MSNLDEQVGSPAPAEREVPSKLGSKTALPDTGERRRVLPTNPEKQRLNSMQCEKYTGPLLPTSKGSPPAARKTWLELAVIVLGVGSMYSLAIWAGMFDPQPGFLTKWDKAKTLESRPAHAAAKQIDQPFISNCHDLLKAPEATYPDRLARLSSTISHSVWVAEPGPSVEYFLGAFGPGSWHPSERPFLVAIHKKEIVIITPAFELSRAQQHALPDSIKDRITWLPWAESESPYAVLAKHFDAPVVLDAQVRNFIGDGIRSHLKVETNDDVSRIRQVKDDREIELMRCANQFTLAAIRKTRERMHIGIRESETRRILYEEMEGLGLSDNGALILFGENAALPHGTGTDRVLKESDLVLIDAGGRWGGYVADITRTFDLEDSKIPDAHKEVWEIVRVAQAAPAELIEKSEEEDHVHFSWLDDAARERVKRGMAAYGVRPARGPAPDYTVFTHRLGHGIGLEGHEAPYCVQGDVGEQRVKFGNAVTFEPGVYIPAGSEVGDESVRGLGVRLEDVVVFREEKGKMVVDWMTGPVGQWGDI